MSVIRLLKDCKLGKRGEVIDRVPFLDAKDLCVAGVAERPGPDGFGEPVKVAKVEPEIKKEPAK